MGRFNRTLRRTAHEHRHAVVQAAMFIARSAWRDITQYRTTTATLTELVNIENTYQEMIA